ncbi:hypothetical protein PDESU_02696 [Pontiella desulfatans]|uniref:Caspase family p20 domain-containing protein n=2 Tax=Pontiella desulfatans TaxID=2750659 RepID=A0A6C2U2P0_PONDE|nr:hypothetical protein PDESU_02696 [Pontiella desulfatans]
MGMLLVCWSIGSGGNPLSEPDSMGKEPRSLQTPERFRENLKQMETASVRGKENKYAVLVNADKNNRLHGTNISKAYKAFKAAGFSDSDIIILNHLNPRSDMSPDRPYPTTTSNHEMFKDTLTALSRIVDYNDLLFVYCTGHGKRVGGAITLAFRDQTMSAMEYCQLLEKISALTIVSVMDQCYSGGFSSAIENSYAPIISITDTDEKHATYCQHFAEQFWSSFSRIDCSSTGTLTNSLEAIFSEALIVHKDKLKQTPARTRGKITYSKGMGW